MKKSITSLLKGWCAALLCAGLTLPSFAAADADAAFAAQRHDLKLSLHNGSPARGGDGFHPTDGRGLFL